MSSKNGLDSHKDNELANKYEKKYINPRGEMEPFGFNPFTNDYQKKLEVRADRFGVEETIQSINQKNLQELFSSLGVKFPVHLFKEGDYESTNDDLKDNDDVDDRGIRYDAIHLHGVDDMSTEDIFSYLHDFPPKHIEWVNDSSCNIVYSDVLNVCKVLLHKSMLYHEVEKENTPEEQKENAMEVDNETISEKWRLGNPCDKSKKLLMRFATVSDVKKLGKSHKSKFYQKYGKLNEKLWTKNFDSAKNKKPEKVEIKKSTSPDMNDENDKTNKVSENKKSVKERLGSRLLAKSEERLSPDKPFKRRSVERYSPRKRPQKSNVDDGLTTFDRHIKEELEERKARKRKNPSELWPSRRKTYDPKNDFVQNDYREDYDDRLEKDYFDVRSNRGQKERSNYNVRSRLGQVKKSRMDDDGFSDDDHGRFGRSIGSRKKFTSDDDDDERPTKSVFERLGRRD